MARVADTAVVKEPMLDAEASPLMGTATAITTVTFFRSDDIRRAVSLLRGRFATVLMANPWLAGRLKSRGEKRLTLIHPKADSITEAHVAELFEDARDRTSIDPAMAYKRSVPKSDKQAPGSGRARH